MLADPLLAALDDALECPLPGDPVRADRLALALWWLVDRLRQDLQISPPEAAAQVAMLCGLAKEMFSEKE